jgi:hypothetical protein
MPMDVSFCISQVTDFCLQISGNYIKQNHQKKSNSSGIEHDRMKKGTGFL